LKGSVVVFSRIYDLIGVGIGPFNLGLACLLEKVSEADGLFFEQKPEFDWHPGMLIEGTRLQVPFLADLVTMADPTNPYSYLNYLKEHNRLFHFYFLQRLEMPRNEYNHYCQWTANKLDNCRFGKRVTNIVHATHLDEPCYEVEVYDVLTEASESYFCKNLVMGVGTVPTMPESFRGMPGEDVFHTADFLEHQERCRDAKSITVVGSGQSAAEVFRELLKEQDNCGYRLDWFTRSKGYFPMEETKLSLEHFSPDYIDYFYALPQEQKDEIFSKQDLLYKGISAHTITDIYNLLYEFSVAGKELNAGLVPLIEVNAIHQNREESYTLECRQWQQDKAFTHESEVVIVATGYRPNIPSCIEGISGLIQWDAKDRYRVGKDYRLKLTEDIPNEIFVHSGMSHTHGVGSTNLGLAVHRNKIIINTLIGCDVYPVHDDNIFQQFGIE
jgi:lysine N6-hydroxylase